MSIWFSKLGVWSSFGKCGEIMNPSDFEIAARTHARLPYSFLRHIFIAGCSKNEVCEAWF